MILRAKERREDSDYEDEINKLSIGDIDEIFASAAAKENSEDIEDVLKRELRLRKKIDEAEEKLERGREKINELAEKKKEELDREMSLMQDKNSLEFGLIANDLDAELKKMAEESEIAKKRNEALKEELRLLAEELARGTSRASSEAPRCQAARDHHQVHRDLHTGRDTQTAGHQRWFHS